MKHSLFWLLDDYPELGESPAARYEVVLDQAAEADRLGFTSLWIAEHHFRTIGTAPNPAVLLAAIAQRTRTIRLGPAISVLPLRNPIHSAEDYALVDVLSGGRLNMGVGSGSDPAEYVPFGVDFELRKEIFDSHLASLREHWRAAVSGEPEGVSINLAPVQRPAPPIYVATLSEQSAYRIGLAGDSLLTLLPPPAEGLDRVVATVDAHAQGLREAGSREAGSREAGLKEARAEVGSAESVVMMFAHVADTEAEVRKTVIPALSRLMLKMTGSELPDAEAFYRQVRHNKAGLFGTPTEVAEQLEVLESRGIGHVAFVSRFGGMSESAAAQSLQRLAPRLSPRARRREKSVIAGLG